ncbi:MAG: MAPEG family protein [Amylibacter sp.]|nr:MAPEG family protein [Amylibacter sp.]
MTLEMNYLAMYGLVILLIILVQVLISASQHGLLPLLGNRENLELTGITHRADRVVQNSLVAMALVAPPILMLAITNVTTSGTVLAVQIFLTARILYAVCFILGVIYLRTLTWVTGFVATAYLYLGLL